MRSPNLIGLNLAESGYWVSFCQPNLIDCGHDNEVELAWSVGIISDQNLNKTTSEASQFFCYKF